MVEFSILVIDLSISDRRMHFDSHFSISCLDVITNYPANMCYPTKLCMCVTVPSQEPVIQWLLFVYVLDISFSFIFYKV